jgi:hypothetical protein
MSKKSSTRPICKYCNGCKKNQQLFMKHICKYCNGCKKINNYLRDLYVGIVMDAKTSNYLWDLYVGIAYLKWPCINYNRNDVGIVECSFWFL